MVCYSSLQKAEARTELACGLTGRYEYTKGRRSAFVPGASAAERLNGLVGAVPAHFQQMLEEIKRGMVKPVTETSAYLEKRNPAKRQARFYTLRVVPTLFGDWTLVREWGRIGSPGRLTVDWFDTLEEAQSAFDRIKRRKIGRGYRGLSLVRGQRY